MVNWREWLQMLLALMVLVSLAEMLLPAGGLAKFSKLIFGLILILAVLQPLLTLFYQNWDELEFGFLSSSGSGFEWQTLGSKIKSAGEKPFFRNDDWAAVQQIEVLLLALDQVGEVDVDLTVSSMGIEGVEVRIDSSDPQLKTKAQKMVAGFFNLPQELIIVQELE